MEDASLEGSVGEDIAALEEGSGTGWTLIVTEGADEGMLDAIEDEAWVDGEGEAEGSTACDEEV